MTVLADKRSILGIDPTSRGLAFAYFGDGRLLDWGTRWVPGDELKAFKRILELCPADILVIEDPMAKGCERRSRVRRLLGTLTENARARSLAVIKVARAEVRESWRATGRLNKREVAMAIAESFPPLEPLVPRVRKPYRSEVGRAEIFDAASLVLHALANSSKNQLVPIVAPALDDCEDRTT